MSEAEILFNIIADDLSEGNTLVKRGQMMSSPGLKYMDKVFAFYYNKQMIFKLGNTFDPITFGIENYSLLSPFKNKPPMAGWFQISFEDGEKWKDLASQALNLMQKN